MKHLGTILGLFLKKRAALAVVLLASVSIGWAGSSYADSFVPAHDTLRATVAAGATASFEVLITDVTTHAITVSASVYSTNSTGWHIGDYNPLTIGADTTHTGHFNVSFSDLKPGTYSASLRMYDSISATLKYVTLLVTVTGEPASLHVILDGSFLATPVGTTVCHPVLIYFPGDSTSVTLTSIALEPSSSVLSLSLDSVSLPESLAAGHTAVVTVCFSPTSASDAIDTVVVEYTVHDSSRVAYAVIAASGVVPTPTSQLHVYAQSYAGTPIGTSVCHPVIFYAAIDSGVSITVSAPTLTSSSSVWSVNTNGLSFPLTLTHGQVDTVIVCLDPTSTGDYRDSLLFNYTDTHDSSRSTVVALVGNGVQSTSCFRLDGDTSSAFYAVAGNSSDRDIKIVNGTSNPWVITSVTSACDTAVWSIEDLSFPDTIAAGGSVGFVLVFHAPSVTSTERYACTLEFHGHDGSGDCEKSWNVHGYSSPDTTKVALVPDTTQKIAFAATQPGATWKIVKVTNNSGKLVKVEGISLTSTAYFGVSLVSPDSTLPFYLSGDGSIWIKLTLNDSIPGTYNDTLLLTTEDGATALAIPIQALVHDATAGVGMAANSHEQFTLGVNPNPSRGAVNVSLNGITHATVQVLDILGRVIWQVRNVSNSVQWQGGSSTGALVNSGIYIVRATGETASGTTATASTRVSIQR